MAATLEPVAFVLRAGPDHHHYGDPFDFSATVIGLGKTAHVFGATGTLPPKSAIRAALAAAGFREVKWERIITGLIVPHESEV